MKQICRSIKKNKKWFRRGLFIIIFFIFLKSHFLNRPRSLNVNFFDVGQGDSSLIKTPGDKYILIDGGPDNRVLKQLGKKIPFWERKIDLILISHFHDDHIVGLIEIIKRYKIGIIIMQKDSPTSLTYQLLLENIKAQNIKHLFLEDIYNVNLGDGCEFNLIPPNILKLKKDDNNSLISKLSCENKSFLFSGDNNVKAEKALIESGFNLKSDIFKASHHGSITANSLDFLRIVSPRALIISVGKDNKFKHPSPLILERALSLGIETYRTDLRGNVEIIKEY